MTDALVIKGLSKRFGGLRAVQDVSFTVKENETVALIGPNGAGKTTSFHLITGFHRADSGSVQAFGQEIVGLKPHDVCALGLARTFQVAKPFGAMTVLANVMTGAFLRDRHVAAAREKAREAIDFVGLSAREQTAAKDLTTIDQRRLETARALATQPKILLLDEVMAGLNPSEIDQAVALVGKLSARGLTIVIVEHVMRAIMAVARHIVVLDHGQKIAEGAPKEIVENPEVIRAYLGSYVHTPPTGGAHA
jgi:branched-chain amino acid transport system ATP-binding protein